LIHKYSSPISLNKYAVKTFDAQRISQNDYIKSLPYELIIADAAHDIWALGILMYHLFSGAPFFLANSDDNLDDTELAVLYEFSDEFKKSKLSRITDLMARNLVSQLLSKQPQQRPTIDSVLSHPFLSGGRATRLVGENPEFDVFLSYRVSTDSDHVKKVYESLTRMGLKVWYDRKCLMPGVSWEQG
jgi:serine/threonine protein kinase